MKYKPNTVRWCDNGWLPFHYGFCPNEKAWKKEMRRLGKIKEDYPIASGHCTIFGATKSAHKCAIITLNADCDEWPLSKIIGILVHECVHAWREACDHMGEDKPSSEFEAYAMQRMTESVLAAYLATRRPKFRTKG